MEGFLTSEHLDRFSRVPRGCVRAGCATGACATGRRSSRGPRTPPSAFLGLLRGESIGKMLVRVGPVDSLGGRRPRSLSAASRGRAREITQPLGVSREALRDEAVDSVRRVGAVGPAPARAAARQQLDPLVDRAHRPDVEAALAHGLDHLLVEHQVADVGRRDDHALLAGEPAALQWRRSPRSCGSPRRRPGRRRAGRPSR